MGQIVELTLDSIAHGGEALGRYAGKVVFVPYAIPGERVRAEILEEKPRWARTRLVEVLTASPHRVDPPCPYFGPDRCDGCQWQHIAYEYQAALKQEIVTDQLRRLGHMPAPNVTDVIALAPPGDLEESLDLLSEKQVSERTAEQAGLLAYGYRNYAQFAIAGGGGLGYRRAASHDVIAVDRCLLLHERLDELHGALDVAWPGLTGVNLRVGVNTGQALIVLETSEDDQPELEINQPAACALLTPLGVRPLIGEPFLEEIVHGRRYRISADSFFPVNTSGAEALVDLVRAYAEPRPGDVLLDAYCGVGLFALSLADSVAEAIGIESSPSACEDFAHNAADLPNVTLHEGSVEDVLPALRTQRDAVNLAVLDPPRSGAGIGVIRELAALRPRRIVYVSCDPATLARDSVHLEDAGFRLVEAQPVDMFPQTYHVETVALWTKNE